MKFPLILEYSSGKQLIKSVYWPIYQIKTVRPRIRDWLALVQKHSKFEGLVYISFPKVHLFRLNLLAHLTSPSSLPLTNRAVWRSPHEGCLPRGRPLGPQRMAPGGPGVVLRNSWAWGLTSMMPQIRLILRSPDGNTSHTSTPTDSSLTPVTLQWDIDRRVLLNLLLVTADHSHLFKNLQPILFSYKPTQMLLVAQSCLTLCDPMGCSRPSPLSMGILQAKLLEWVAISFSRAFTQPGDQTWVSCMAGQWQANSLPTELLGKPISYQSADKSPSITYSG